MTVFYTGSMGPHGHSLYSLSIGGLKIGEFSNGLLFERYEKGAVILEMPYK
jgi:hypothetical protein